MILQASLLISGVSVLFLRDEIGYEIAVIAQIISIYIFLFLVDLFMGRHFAPYSKRWWLLLPGAAIIAWQGTKLLDITPVIGGGLVTILIFCFLYFLLKPNSEAFKSD